MTKVSQLNQTLYEQLMMEYNHSNDHSGVKGDRLANRLSSLSLIGRTENGGVRRIAFSPEERKAKELVKNWMEEAGLKIREDGAGNVFGRFEGKDPSSVVLSGSHVDSVPDGGHFDGPLGVLAALEVTQAWKDEGYVPNKSFEVVIFTDEEGARFNGGLTGSRAMVGEINLEQQNKLRDFNGKSFEEVIKADGLTSESFSEAKRDLSEIAAYVEVHIEQGKRLEKEQLPVGIVTGIAGPCWLNVKFIGDAGHAGNTPMNDRRDALVAASEFVQKVKDLPSTVSDTAVATVGKLEVLPNGVNVIPGEVRLTVDIRDIYTETRDSLVQLITNAANDISRHHQIELVIEETYRIVPVPIEKDMQEKAAAAVKQTLGIKPYFLPSGAGHDAMIVGRYVPMAMLFTQSKAGVSHNPEEWSSLQDCVQTVHVLKNFIEQLTK